MLFREAVQLKDLLILRTQSKMSFREEVKANTLLLDIIARAGDVMEWSQGAYSRIN